METNQPLQTSNNVNMAKSKKPASSKGGKTIEEMYQKKSQLEHILLRPDTYIGSIEKHTQSLWVYEKEEMVYRSVTYVPGLYKIFDEILVNAADNKQRDPSMDSVKVVIDVEENLISVCNSGDGVPVEIHQEEGVYVPEMIFGHLLTSSNYDDNVKKTTGGRNGYGAKLTNIFSTHFTIETADGKRSKKYKQVFENNMGKKSVPEITKCSKSENWTKVTFKPDLSKFSMTELEADVVALMSKRVFDIAGCLGKSVKVELNGKRIPVKSFGDYVDLYLNAANKGREEPLPRISGRVNDRWEICVSLSDGQFQQVSFVNSIATIKGGTHVDYVTSQIANYIVGIVNKKNKKNKTANVKAHNVKNHLWVFVNALIDNPAFDSQTKETLTLRQSSFGSKCEISEDVLKKGMRCLDWSIIVELVAGASSGFSVASAFFGNGVNPLSLSFSTILALFLGLTMISSYTEKKVKMRQEAKAKGKEQAKGGRKQRKPPVVKKTTKNVSVSQVGEEASSSAMDTDIAEVPKPKGRQPAKKKAPAANEDDEDDMMDLAQRLSKYNLGDSSNTDAIAIDDDDVVEVPEPPKKGGRKAAAAPRKRGAAAASKKVQEVVPVAESPEKVAVAEFSD